jgi:hypothetical protein
MSPPVVTPGDPLTDLRGYHLPDPVSWWPPAPGWWVLALLGLCLAALFVHWLASRYRRGAAMRVAKAELAGLRADFARDRDAGAYARGLSRLLRRFALSRFPRDAVAGLTGEKWLAFLDSRGGEGRFADGPGSLLLEAPYRSISASDAGVDELAELVLDWIRRNGRAPG